MNIFKKTNEPISLTATPQFLGYDKYPSRSRACHYCNHKCATVANVRLRLPSGDTTIVELGDDCYKKFMGKKHRKCSGRTGTRGFLVKCSICNRLNLHNRSKYNSKPSTERNSVDWVISPYICDVCDRENEPLVGLIEKFQLKLNQHHIDICKRFGKTKNPIDGKTFNTISQQYTDSNFDKNTLKMILLLLENIENFENNKQLLIKFVLYFGCRNILKNDDSCIIDLQFLPRILMKWFLALSEVDIFTHIGGVCFITDSDSDED